jgi:hypothetical protein
VPARRCPKSAGHKKINMLRHTRALLAHFAINLYWRLRELCPHGTSEDSRFEMMMMMMMLGGTQMARAGVATVTPKSMIMLRRDKSKRPRARGCGNVATHQKRTIGWCQPAVNVGANMIWRQRPAATKSVVAFPPLRRGARKTHDQGA